MGLDYIELVLAIEETFQVHFEDWEIHRVETFDDLNQLIRAKLQLQGSGACLTSVAFYRTRRALVDSLGIDRREVRTLTPIELLLPRDRRREKWRKMSDSQELKFPSLAHPWWVHLNAMFAGVAWTVAPAMCVGVKGLWLLVVGLAGLVIGAIVPLFFPSLATEFPNREVTVGDLARDVLAANYRQLAAEVGSASNRDVWETMLRVIVAQTGVEAGLIKPGASLVETLQID
jgi:hypothetical protein